ncbi:nicotinamidase [Advenella mimigardefordensis]|uniref:nicotinamidase n=1 Tax=Advenella mimigardefordensis (strain DSM 17166 / LMG 22922 / DPN7) TaxID=1247726 RepID=W0PD41_ADVMD|nr:nicotinamidase [Advenella mimigardefordensis]AHG63330.1 pyrazinamidase/nicotinamidase [Advenella mimigardefordensis DPN7]
MTNSILPHSALILVDIQPDFMAGGPLACEQADTIVAPVQAILAQNRFAHYVATQDWHPGGHISFASSHSGSKPFDSIALYGHPQVLWPDHCVQGTNGAALHSGINWDRMHVIVRKGADSAVDSYSAFRENYNQAGERPATGLTGWLKDRQVQDVYIAGLARDVCVLWSAQDARAAGFNTFVIWDATAPVTGQTDADTRKTLVEQGIRIVHSEELTRNR